MIRDPSDGTETDWLDDDQPLSEEDQARHAIATMRFALARAEARKRGGTEPEGPEAA